MAKKKKISPLVKAKRRQRRKGGRLDMRSGGRVGFMIGGSGTEAGGGPSEDEFKKKYVYITISHLSFMSLQETPDFFQCQDRWKKS